MSTWTKAIPTPQTGSWYWWRGIEGSALYPHQIITHPDGIKIWTNGEWQTPKDGYWWSEPIETPPELDDTRQTTQVR